MATQTGSYDFKSAKAAHDDAAKTASDYITEITDDGIMVHADGEGPDDTQTPSGWHISDVLEYIRQGVSRFWIGLKNQGDTTPTVRIGKDYVSGAPDNESHMELDYHSLQLIDKEGNTYFHVSDLRDSEGLADVTERFACDGTTSWFDVRFNIASSESVSAYVSGEEVAISEVMYSRTVVLESAPARNSDVEIRYTSDDEGLKAFTFGRRDRFGNIGPASIVAGIDAEASGYSSHAEGQSRAKGDYSHAEGAGFDLTPAPQASGLASHAEGCGTLASGDYSHAEGAGTNGGLSSYLTKASGDASHAEGYSTVASGYISHSEGYRTTASMRTAHSEGERTTAGGWAAHAEGYRSASQETGAHSEGCNTQASGIGSHAEGGLGEINGTTYSTSSTVASGAASHAEGVGTTASARAAHSEGEDTSASENWSHAEGYASTASGGAAHAQNYGTVAASFAQTAIGQYNVSDANGTYAAIIGNGTADNARSNALAVRWNGLTDIAGRTAYPLFIYNGKPTEANAPVTPCFIYDTSDGGLYHYSG